MSLLKSAKRSTTGALSVRVPDVSTSTVVLVRGVIPPPMGSNRYPSLSVVFLAACTIPYNYKKGTDTNTVTDQDKFAPIMIPGGGTTNFVSIFSVPFGISAGDIVAIDGLYFTAYEKADGKRGTSLTCVKIVKCETPFVPSEIWKIPRECRLPSMNRDVLVSGRMFESQHAPYTFFVVRITASPSSAEDGEAYGDFQVPAAKDINGYSFVPHQENKNAAPKGRIDALTGGTNSENKVDDNQLVVCINGFDSESESSPAVLISVRCRLYSDSICRFMVGSLWTKLGPVMMPHLEGTALCVTDPSKTGNQIYDPNCGYNGALYASVTLFPNLAVTSKACGIPCTWDEAIAIGGKKLSTPNALVSGSFSNSVLSQATAVNLLEYTGDATRLKQAFEEGEVSFYVVANFLDKVRRDITSKKSSVITVCTEPNFEENFVNSEVAIAVYACVSEPTSPFRIHDYLRPYADMPAAIDTMRKQDAKRVHREELSKAPAASAPPSPVKMRKPAKTSKKARVAKQEEEEESE